MLYFYMPVGYLFMSKDKQNSSWQGWEERNKGCWPGQEWMRNLCTWTQVSTQHPQSPSREVSLGEDFVRIIFYVKDSFTEGGREGVREREVRKKRERERGEMSFIYMILMA